MTRVYLDACTIIYLVEGCEPFHTRAVAELDLIKGAASEWRPITSRLSMLECRVRPLRENQAPLLAAYDAFFSMGHIIVCELDASVIERATQLRAAYGFRTPDAIHLATAIQAGADAFLTSDLRLRQCREVNVRVLV